MPKIDERIQCNFSEDAERWQKIDRKTQSTFVFYFDGFSKFDRKVQQKIVEKTVCLWTLQNQFLQLLLVRPIPTTYLLKTATLL